MDELSRQIAKAATQDEIHGIINCCTGNPVSLADKVEEFIKEHGFKIRPNMAHFLIDRMIHQRYGEMQRKLER